MSGPWEKFQQKAEPDEAASAPATSAPAAPDVGTQPGPWQKFGDAAGTPVGDGQDDVTEQKAMELADKWEKLSPSGEAGTGELFGNAFALGLKDKVAGLSGAASSLFDENMTIREGYNVSRRAQEILEERARERTGGYGTAAEVIGTVGTGVLAKAPAAATALGRMLQGGKEAAILGTGQGVGDSEADTVGGIAADAAKAGAASAAAGAVLTGAVEAGRGLFRGGRAALRGAGSLADEPQGRAARKVVKALADDGLTPEQAAARMKNRDTALVNAADENTLGLGRSASAKPGEGRTTLNKALDAQQKGSRGKIMTAVSDALGGADETFNTRVADMVTTKANLGDKQYRAAFAKNFDDAAKGAQETLEGLLPRVPGEAVKNAQKIAQAEGRAFGQQLVASIDDAGNVAFSRSPSLQEWHYIQRGLRSATDSAYRAGVGEVGTAYKSLHKQILGAMDDASSLYQTARRTYASQSDLIEAIQRGREILAPSTTKNVDALVDELGGLSKAEKDLVRVGLARQLQDMVDATPDTAGDMVRKIFGTKAKRDAIRAVFDSDSQFRKFQAQMMSTAKELKSFQYVRTGSRTKVMDAETQSAGALADAATTAMDVASGHAGGTLLRGASKMLRDLGGMDEDVAREAAKILVERDPQAVLKALQKSSGRAKGQAARDALLAKAAPIARALSLGSAAGAGTEMVVSGAR